MVLLAPIVAEIPHETNGIWWRWNAANSG